jgi:hypothetical protein
MNDPDRGVLWFSSVEAWVRTDPTVQQVARMIPSWVNTTTVKLALMVASVAHEGLPGVPHEGLAGVPHAEVPEVPHAEVPEVPHEHWPEDPTTEDLALENARNVGEIIEVKQEVPLTPDTSIPISGKEVEAQAAEIMALQVDHEATLQMLHEDLNKALKERADKDAALAEKLPADLGPGGQKMLEEAQAANQKQIKDDYAAEEANLRLQQGREMAGLQTKQVAEQNRDGR